MTNILNWFLTPGGSPIFNQQECPLAELTDWYEVIPSSSITGAISVFHECGDSCGIANAKRIIVEREEVTVGSKKTIKHDLSNNMYCINFYCMNYFKTVTV